MSVHLCFCGAFISIVTKAGNRPLVDFVANTFPPGPQPPPHAYPAPDIPPSMPAAPVFRTKYLAFYTLLQHMLCKLDSCKRNEKQTKVPEIKSLSKKASSFQIKVIMAEQTKDLGWDGVEGSQIVDDNRQIAEFVTTDDFSGPSGAAAGKSSLGTGFSPSEPPSMP
ncbi:hypothetical protein Moror_8545 [Moniliophthora roreri MCA 2997]|uniref:Uncharacterized protein n=1 Tax=Moniliophthora roreri (strain MCA 2997) TaxID=1381753 RepID=V2XSQ7_MONRO|nr:hypothetical protein Moror_8545 [Moniliophthora roreri MCA 2997]